VFAQGIFVRRRPYRTRALQWQINSFYIIIATPPADLSPARFAHTG
jgi:hypothetical protein